MPIYTRTGDHGETGLFGNRRVPKDHLRIEAYGTVDELNSVIGLCAAETGMPADVLHALPTIQSDLFEIGADLATEGGKASLKRIVPATADMERWIDASEAELPALRSFVLPGGSRAAALLHVARTVARRAERQFWTLAHELGEGPAEHHAPAEIGIYLNRLSDLFFSWARLANKRNGVDDVPWTGRA